MREGKIGPSEGFFAIANTIICVELFSRSSNVSELGNTLWYSVLGSALIGALIFSIAIWLMHLENTDSLQNALRSVGKPLEPLMLWAFALIFLVIGLTISARFSILVKEYVFLNTQNATLLLAILVVVFYLAFWGLETITRSSKLFFIILIVSFLLLGACTYKWFNFYSLFPLGGGGFGKIASNTLQRTVSFLPACALALFAVNLHGKKHAAKAGFKALACSALVCSVILLGVSSIFSFEYMGGMDTPLLRLASITVLGSYYQRLNDAFVFIWLSSTIVCASFLIYTSANMVCRAIKTKRIRLVLLLLAPICFVVGILLNEEVVLVQTIIDTLLSYSWLAFLLLFILALLISLARKRKEVKHESKL